MKEIHQQMKIACKKKLRADYIQGMSTTVWSTFFDFLFAKNIMIKYR